jgi:hypothetical protein
VREPQISVNVESKTLEHEGLEVRVSSIEVSPRAGYGWHATLRLQRDLVLHLQWSDGDDHVVVEAWRDKQYESEGVAVIGDAQGPLGLTTIPVCGCGDYGCSAVGRNFRSRLTLFEIADVSQIFRRLPYVTAEATPENRWEPTT